MNIMVNLVEIDFKFWYHFSSFSQLQTYVSLCLSRSIKITDNLTRFKSRSPRRPVISCATKWCANDRGSDLQAKLPKLLLHSHSFILRNSNTINFKINVNTFDAREILWYVEIFSKNKYFWNNKIKNLDYAYKYDISNQKNIVAGCTLDQTIWTQIIRKRIYEKKKHVFFVLPSNK